MKLNSLISAFLILSSATAFAGKEGGGGNVFPEVQTVDRNSVVETVHEIKGLIPTIRAIEVSLTVSDRRVVITQLSDARYFAKTAGLTSTDIQKLFWGPNNLYHLIQFYSDANNSWSNLWNVQDGPCFDPADTKHLVAKDASATGAGTNGVICVSIGNLAKSTQAASLRVKLFALLAHELTHLALGSDEAKAKAIQTLAEQSLNSISNFNAVKRLDNALVGSLYFQGEKLTQALESWNQKNKAAACTALEDAESMDLMAGSTAISASSEMGTYPFGIRDDSRYVIAQFGLIYYLRAACAGELKGHSQIFNDFNQSFGSASSIPASSLPAKYWDFKDLFPYTHAEEKEVQIQKINHISDTGFAVDIMRARDLVNQLAKSLESQQQ